MSRWVSLALLFVMLWLPALAASDKLQVVVSFSILKDIVSRIAKDHATVVSIVGPNQDTHIFEPTPETSKLVLQADLVILNGLNFEKWFERVIQASGYKGPIVIASQGIKPITLHQTSLSKTHLPDPHVWHAVSNVLVWVNNIERSLAEIDAKNAHIYKQNAVDYLKELDRLDGWIKDQFKQIPPEKRCIITTHDAFGYYSHAYEIQFLSPMGLTTETEPSAFAIAELIQHIRRNKISMIFLENMTNDRLMRQISKETGVKIGGTLYSDALSFPGEAGDTYLKMMRHNTALFKRTIDQEKR